MHKDEIILPVKRKRSEEVSIAEKEMKKIKLNLVKDNKNICIECGSTFSYINSYNWHIKKCHKRQQDVNLIKEDSTIITKKVISKPCPDCDVLIEAQNLIKLLSRDENENTAGLFRSGPP